jgi:hypothetical protein
VLVTVVVLAGPVAAQEGKLLDTEARAACEAAGGYVGRGIGPDELCIRPTGDAGKACTTNADCETFCLADTATCGEWTPLFGCHDVLVGEGQSVAICVD